ncbi:reverse transcriptase, partial [Globisporangium splendens]
MKTEKFNSSYDGRGELLGRHQQYQKLHPGVWEDIEARRVPELSGTHDYTSCGVQIHQNGILLLAVPEITVWNNILDCTTADGTFHGKDTVSFQIDLSSKMSDRLPGIIAEGRKLRGTFCAEWLPYMTSTADGWLLDSNGSPYKLAHTSLSVGTAQLGDILRWEWIRPGVLNFIPTCGISGFSRPSIRALERLCATLVSNFPQLLYRPQQTNVLRLYNGQRHYNHEWHLHTSEATLTHVDTTLVKATHTVHSAMDCDIMATRDLNGQKVSFHAHPRFTRIVQLWVATDDTIRPDLSIGNKLQQRGHKLAKILEMQQSTKLSIQQDLWITVYTAQTLLRLKANRLSMWNYEKADLSCSNPECSQVVQSSVQHLFWECPKAKLVWNYFYALWAKIGITPGHDPAIWIFSLDLPDTPRHAWTTIKRHIIGHKCSNEHLQDHLYSVAHTLWRYMSASLIQTIWCAHLRRMDSDPIESTAEMAIMMTRLEAGMRNLTRLAEAQAGDSDGNTVAAVLKAYVDCFLSQTDAIPLTPSDTRGVYLLFFDGGSRGNPGPGGTGSIIVRVHKDSHTASLIWAASMAYSRKDTTNNFAEYWGLIHGLREAQRSHFEPLYVIGDSALIISQQRMHRSPRQHRLARLYQTSRRLADCIDIRGWYHHYRAFNKMADSAANLAMDTRTSTQVHFPTHRAAFNNLTQDLDNDVMHWLMRSSEDPRQPACANLPHLQSGNAMHCAVLTKDLSTVKTIYEVMEQDSTWKWEPDLLHYAARDHSFGIMDWLYEHAPRESIQLDKETTTKLTLGLSACVGILKWFCECKYDFSDDPIDEAVRSYQLDAVRCLHAYKVGGCTPKAMALFAPMGSLDLVTLLHENYSSVRADSSAMDAAARYGSLNMVQFLHFNRTEGYTLSAMDGAVGGGYIEIVEILHEFRTEGCALLGRWIEQQRMATWKSSDLCMTTGLKDAPPKRWTERLAKAISK